MELKFFKAVVCGILFYCEEYTRVHKRNSYCVSNYDGTVIKYAQIEYFVAREDGHFAIVRTFTTSDFPSQTIHRGGKLLLVQVDSSIQPQAVPLRALSGKVIFIEIDSKKYVALFPNSLNYDKNVFKFLNLINFYFN